MIAAWRRTELHSPPVPGGLNFPYFSGDRSWISSQLWVTKQSAALLFPHYYYGGFGILVIGLVIYNRL